MTSESWGLVMTPKQRRFVDEYMKDLNATQAAIRAGYSRKTANQQGPALLSDPEISAAIDLAKTERSERTKVDSDWVLERLVEEAEADLADLYDEKGNLLPVEEWPAIWRSGLVAGIETEELFDGRGEDRVQIGVVKKLRLSDRLKRIELIGKHVQINAFSDPVASGFDGLGDRLERALKRARG